MNRFFSCLLTVSAVLFFVSERMSAQTEAGLEELMFINIPPVVVASRSEESIKDVPASVTVITAEEIEASGARYLTDVLRLVPGFHISMDQDDNNVIGTRGIMSDNNQHLLIMLDGKPAGDTLNSGASGNHIIPVTLENVKRIEIARGPASILWGTEALVGIINIVTKDAEDQKGLSVKATAGSYGAARGWVGYGKTFSDDEQMTLNFKYGKSDGQYAASGYENGRWPKDAEIVREGFLPGYEFYSKYALGPVRLSFRKMHSIIKTTRNSYKDEKFEYVSNEFMVKYDKELSDTVSLQFAGWWDQHGQFTMPSKEAPDTAQEYNADKEERVNIDVSVHSVTDKNSLLVGLNTRYNEYHWGTLLFYHHLSGYYEPFPDLNKDSSTATTGNIFGVPSKFSEHMSYAVYVQDKFRLADKVTLIGAARADYDSYDSKAQISPRAGVIYDPAKDTTIKVLYNTSVLMPNQWQKYLFWNTRSSGEKLDPMQLTGIEAIWMQGLGGGLEGTLNVYQQDVKDVIVFLFEGSIWPYVPAGKTKRGFYNTGDYKTTGSELELRYSAYKYSVFASAGYAATKVETAFDGAKINSKDEAIGFPAVKATVGGYYKVGEKLMLYADARHVGETKHKDATGADIDVPGNMKIDINVTADITKSLKLGLLVRNITDNTEQENITIENGVAAGIGREVEGSVQYRF
ncbi:MAG: TonB-dependent receptor [Endomicrobiales bacterium]|nr:TonB-dependent receptor [Endomicrobiales bacterium]